MRWLLQLFWQPFPKDITAHPYVKATTPDQLIEAVVIESIAKDFAKWSTQGVELPLKFWDKDSFSYCREGKDYMLELKEKPRVVNLINKSKDITCVFHVRWEYEQKRGLDGKKLLGSHYGHKPYIDSVTVNGVPLGQASCDKIMTAFITLRDQYRKAEKEAKAALQRQQLEEKKWNVAEQLLGLKRNEFGALVPVTPAE